MIKLATQIVAVLVSASIAFAAQTACPEHFLDGQAPDILNQKMQARTWELCYEGYGAMHSGITKGPLYSAEHLTRDRLKKAKGLVRKNEFHAEPSLPAKERSELRYYARSGYDRGHIAPSADMPTEQAQYESFSLANIVPQEPENNRGAWSDVEGAVRHLVNQKGDLYVVTGPLFTGGTLQQIKGGVLVPTHLYKVVWDARRGEGGAYLVENTVDARAQMVPIAQVEQLAGFNIFPAIRGEKKERLMALPEPKPYKERRRRQ
ncbi:DNA/RNA non-specific endonuclease [Geobacter anodireducens]